jgi:hypothetical protein
MLYRKQNSIEFHKNKIGEEHFFEKKIKLNKDDLFAEKKMKSKITNLFFFVKVYYIGK